MTTRLVSLKAMLAQFKQELLLAAVVSVVINLLAVVPMVYMLQVFDRVMISQSEITLLVLSLITIFLYLIQSYSELLRSRIMIAAGMRLDAAMSQPVFSALFKDKVSGGEHNPIQVMADLQTIRHWLTGNGLHAFLDAPWIPFFVGIMFFLHPFLGWFCIGGIVSLLFMAYVTAVFTERHGDAAQAEEQSLNQFLYAKMKNAELLEAQGMVANFRRRWWQQQIEFLKTQAHQQEMEERFTATSKQYRYLLNSLALAAGAYLAIQGELTLGAMVAASLVMGRATAPVDLLVNGLRTLQAAKESYERLNQLLSAYPPDIQALSERSITNVSELRGHFQLDGVTLRVPRGDRIILENLTLDLPAGQVIAVVGPSGSGKSTFAKLLLGVWPHKSGQLKLDGMTWPGSHREAWASKIGYMPQEVELFAASLAENICRMETPDSESVIQAAKQVGIHELILRLPRGYDTTMGEAGGQLSGGQKQRVALARAIYKDPQLVIMDEPNANLDEAGEERLSHVIQSLRTRGATVVVISHRPSVLSLADQVLALKRGGVAFWGSSSAFLKQVPINVKGEQA